jgi:hypothetical protein
LSFYVLQCFTDDNISNEDGLVNWILSALGF